MTSTTKKLLLLPDMSPFAPLKDITIKTAAQEEFGEKTNAPRAGSDQIIRLS